MQSEATEWIERVRRDFQAQAPPLVCAGAEMVLNKLMRDPNSPLNRQVFITLQEGADQLQISLRQVQRLVASGRIKTVTLGDGRARRLPPGWVEQLVKDLA